MTKPKIIVVVLTPNGLPLHRYLERDESGVAARRAEAAAHGCTIRIITKGA